jgi:hypothetical protein
MSSDIDERDIPSEYLVEIGRINTRWSALESMIDFCLMRLAGKEITESRSLIIFNHMSFPMKLDVMGALISELLPGYSRLADYQAVIQLLKQVQEKRNAIIHAKWSVNQATQKVEISRFSARGKVKISMAPISTAEIRATADLIIQAIQELYKLVAKRDGITNNPPQSGQ